MKKCYIKNDSAAAIAIVYIILCLFSSVSFAASAKKQFNEVFAVLPGAKLFLQTRNSSVNITTWKNQQIRIDAELKVSGRSYREAQEFLDKIKIHTKLIENAINVITDFSGQQINTEKRGFFDTFFSASSDFQIEIVFRISVPEQIDINITTSLEPVEISGITGTIHVETSENRISLNGIKGAVTAYTTNAVIQANIIELSNAGELTTSNADINISLPENIQTTIQAKAFNGEVKCDFPIVRRGPFSEQIQYGWINGGGVMLYLYTVNGTINIRKTK